MKMFIFAFLFAATAHADFSGNWSGAGQLFSSEGLIYDCAAMSLVVQQTPANIAVTSGHFECSSIAFNVAPVSFDISGGNLVQAGQNVGTIDASGWSTVTNSGNDAVSYDVQATDDHTIDFAEMVVGQTGYVLFSGTLTKP